MRHKNIASYRANWLGKEGGKDILIENVVGPAYDGVRLHELHRHL
jgi:hypothetical protein